MGMSVSLVPVFLLEMEKNLEQIEIIVYIMIINRSI